jgi:hypothetical protein
MLGTLEHKLEVVRKFSPRVSPKRGLVDAGALLLKTIFGTAMAGDVDVLHKTVELMHWRQDDVIHSLDQQSSYFRTLDSMVRFNHQAVVNLSATVKTVGREHAGDVSGDSYKI